MALRERKDWTDEGLVPRALAIHSSLLPSSTQRRMSSTNFLSEIRWFIPMTHRLLSNSPATSLHTLAHIFQYFTAFGVDFCRGRLSGHRGVLVAAGADDPCVLHPGPDRDGHLAGAGRRLQCAGLSLVCRWVRPRDLSPRPLYEFHGATGSDDPRHLGGPDRRRPRPRAPDGLQARRLTQEPGRPASPPAGPPTTSTPFGP